MSEFREQRIAELQQQIANCKRARVLLEELTQDLEANLRTERDAMAWKRYGLRAGDTFLITQAIHDLIESNNSRGIADHWWPVGDAVKVLYVHSDVVIEHSDGGAVVGGIPIALVVRAMEVNRERE